MSVTGLVWLAALWQKWWEPGPDDTGTKASLKLFVCSDKLLPGNSVFQSLKFTERQSVVGAARGGGIGEGTMELVPEKKHGGQPWQKKPTLWAHSGKPKGNLNPPFGNPGLA